MAITTLDGAVAGMLPPNLFFKGVSGTLVANRPHSFFYTAGIPAPGAAPASGLGGAALTAPLAGCFPFTSGGAKNYLSRLQASASAQGGTLLLCDRLWSNSGLTITQITAQTINSAAFPARDQNGSTNGVGVLVGVEVSGATGAGTPTLTLGYTNDAGTAGRTATNIVATVASSIAGTFYPIGLQSGDTGVRSIQTFTQSATWTSGTIHLVAYRPIVAIDLSAAGVPNSVDVLSGGMPELWGSSCLWPIFIPITTTTTTLSGTFQQTNG